MTKKIHTFNFAISSHHNPEIRKWINFNLVCSTTHFPILLIYIFSFKKIFTYHLISSPGHFPPKKTFLRVKKTFINSSSKIPTIHTFTSPLSLSLSTTFFKKCINLLLFINFKLFFVKLQFFLFIPKKISIHIVVTIPDQFLFLIWSPMLSATTPAANLNGTTFQDWLASGCLITIFSHTQTPIHLVSYFSEWPERDHHHIPNANQAAGHRSAQRLRYTK